MLFTAMHSQEMDVSPTGAGVNWGGRQGTDAKTREIFLTFREKKLGTYTLIFIRIWQFIRYGK